MGVFYKQGHDNQTKCFCSKWMPMKKNNFKVAAAQKLHIFN